MSSYKIFLPPSLPPLDSIEPANIPISFRQIHRPESIGTSIQSSREESLLKRLRAINKVDNGHDRKGKRKAVEPLIRGLGNEVDDSGSMDHEGLYDWSTVSKDKEAGVDTSRRRSRRLNQSNLLTHLPRLRQDDSIISLNTTISHPSQPTPSPLTQNTTSDPNRTIHNLPNWTIPLSKLTPLHTLLSSTTSLKGLHVIVCVSGTSRLVARKTRLERERGKDGTLSLSKWDVVSPLPDDASLNVQGRGKGEVGCTVVLWDKCAVEFGERVRRGDVVLLEYVEFKPLSKRDKPQLVLSPQFPNPKLTILYRTLPRYDLPDLRHPEKRKIVMEDQKYRPDLRVGRSDPGVRRVEGVVKWFAEWVEGEGP